ncbi:hypothetical protein AMJ87_12565 [candidate division WOR_3 bacterium SM23_60]|uniref:Secretion system C-terminal sorting domain-containing protein n=1 Tax=candidate division WOR_3 bacterium SM23_60 TaxID=1703780 RepID=A0A0S8G857_UNCW3|nr:MAG: hypothetical protein AMJ87_12565 [candidate division WOR_3 bacterium SM23_60]
MLARIADNYPGRVAAIEMHVGILDSFYLPEALDRMHYYPPPESTVGNWFYTSPWLWFDGDKHGTEDYNTWESKIVNRMMQDAPVTLTMGGIFSATDDTGRVYAHFRNDSTDTITGRVIFVITEDSLYFPSVNGDLWHNHVPRDYVPDHDGQVVSIAPGDSLTVDRFFSLDTNWVDEMCDIVTWIQNDSMSADSIKEIWQGAMIKVTDLTGIHEQETDVVRSTLHAYPNPCARDITFMLDMPSGTAYTLIFYDVIGRPVRYFTGIAPARRHEVTWNLLDQTGDKVSPGIYLYSLTRKGVQARGKIIVR